MIKKIKRIKNKKGFAMAELLAVSMVILLLFSILFSNYLPLVAEYENRVSYNNVTAQYAAHSVRKIFYEKMKSEDGEATNLENKIKSKFNTKNYFQAHSESENINFCENTNLALELTEDEKATCNQIVKEYGIEEIIITKYKLKKFKDDLGKDSGYPQAGELYNYIKYLPTYENVSYQEADEPYRIIIKTEYGYATTPIKTGNMCETRNVDADTSGANAPELDDGMIPVYYDDCDGNWKVASTTNTGGETQWYNYNKKIWANSVTVKSTTDNNNRTKYMSTNDEGQIEYKVGTIIPMNDILTMQVWIPRYKYTVWNYDADGTAPSSPQKIEILWETGTATTGNIKCEDTISGVKGKTSENCTKNDNNETTYTHPAFTFGNDQLKGFWIGKFEISAPTDSKCYTNENVTNCNITEITPIAKPDVKSYRFAQVSTFETNIMAMNDSANIYGFTADTDTHMAKNSEWGAVAYLSHSKYGTCTDGTCEEVYINNSSSYYTGRSGGSANSSASTYGSYSYDGYSISNSNTKTTKDLSKVASTTGNIYGVYDMSGGSREYTMANIVSSDVETMMSGAYNTASQSSGYCGSLNSGGDDTNCTNYPDKKYYDIYSYTTDRNSLIASKLGDAIKEVNNQKIGSVNYAWYSDTNKFVNNENPWFFRGGISLATDTSESSDNSGIFASSYSYGGYDKSYSTRVIMVTK